MSVMTPSREPRWHASIAVLAAIALYVTLPPRLTFGQVWLMPMLVAVLLVPLMVISPGRHVETHYQRMMSVGLIAVLNLFNIATLILLLAEVLAPKGHRVITGTPLLLAAVQIWATNLLVYSLWYWEIDGGGPRIRAHAHAQSLSHRADFLFPQMALTTENQSRLGFAPLFFDYVFLSFNTATAFSPADTFPLTRRAKALMLCESLTSLVTLAVIASRAINILG